MADPRARAFRAFTKSAGAAATPTPALTRPIGPIALAVTEPAPAAPPPPAPPPPPDPPQSAEPAKKNIWDRIADGMLGFHQRIEALERAKKDDAGNRERPWSERVAAAFLRHKAKIEALERSARDDRAEIERLAARLALLERSS